MSWGIPNVAMVVNNRNEARRRADPHTPAVVGHRRSEPAVSRDVEHGIAYGRETETSLADGFATSGSERGSVVRELRDQRVVQVDEQGGGAHAKGLAEVHRAR